MLQGSCVKTRPRGAHQQDGWLCRNFSLKRFEV